MLPHEAHLNKFQRTEMIHAVFSNHSIINLEIWKKISLENPHMLKAEKYTSKLLMVMEGITVAKRKYF